MLPYLPLLGAGAGVALFGVALAIPAVRSLPTGALVGVHLLRAAGAGLVVLARKGLLPREIAEKFGIGEIAVAILGAGVLWLLTMPLDRKPRSVVAWSLFGMINIAWFTLAWMREAPLTAEAWRMGALPVVLYPAVVVPLAVASHLELLRRGMEK
jgi:hypothetical protein